MIGLSLKISGLDRALSLLGVSSAFARAPFSVAAGLLIKREFAIQAGGVFASLGSSIGKPWRPLSPSTARQKSRLYPGRPLMIRTGKLVRSLADENSPDMLYQRSLTKITLGSKVPYAGHHQRGGRRLPARPLYLVTKAGAAAFARILMDDFLLRARGV